MREWVAAEVPVVRGPDDPAIAEVRDPFVFTFEGHRYAVQGAGHPQGRPQILLYGCDDLTRWTYFGPLLTDDDPVAAEVAPAQIWECPNLVQIDGRWVLIISLWRWVEGTHSLAGVRYLLGDLVQMNGGSEADQGLRFVPGSGGLLDTGPAFYAPQASALPDRVLLWGWAWELGRSAEQLEASGWAGSLTFPRELTVRDGVVHNQPAAELTGLRTGLLDWKSGEPFRASAFELVTDGAWSLSLDEPGNRPVLVAEGTGPARVLVDGSMVEAFVAPASHTTRAYPTATSRWVVSAEPGSSLVHQLAL
jgi:beta-fructofuranosidase